ncbi:MAG TPA: hypothetical protein VEC60_14695, partial [Reyranella sp.]|nr:hypothetical protein [Reyranella sp.]
MKVPTLSRKPRDQFSSTRINIFAGWLFFTAWAVVCVTSVAVIVADQYSSTALSGLVAIPGIDPGCNRVIGARFLFWILLLIELFAGARLFFFPFEKGEVQATQTRAIVI